MTHSVTTLTAYNYCARKLFLDRIFSIREPPTKHLVLGGIMHDFVESFSKAEEKLVKSISTIQTKDSLLSYFKKHHSELLKELVIRRQYDLPEYDLTMVEVFEEMWKRVSPLIEDRISVVHNHMQKYQKVGEPLWNVLSPKITCELSVSSKSLGIKGRVDQIEERSEGKYPIELKSGSAPDRSPWKDHQLQLAAYALLLEAEFGTPIHEGAIFYLGSGTKIPLALNPFLKDEVKSLVSQVNAMLQDLAMPPYTENKNKCARCGVREQCYNETLMEEKLQQAKKEKLPHYTEA